jgi:hypothetical protein
MASTATKRPKHDAGPAVVLFGIGDGGKPRAAYFPAAHAELAVKAAKAMNLSVLKVAGPDLSALAAKLPAGRIHANGRGFVPFVRTDLYAKVAGLGEPSKYTPPAVDAAISSANKASADAGAAAAPARSASGAPRIPDDWDQIDVGDLVVAQLADPEDGWWEAVVTDKNGDMVTLRWRQYPRERKVMRHRLNLGRLCPAGTADTAAHCTAQLASAASARSEAEKGSAGKSSGGTDRYPAGWDAICANQVVLAKEEAPLEGWWEAIVAEVSGDTLTMRWRNRPHLPPIVRHRLHLGLLRPKVE